METMLEIIKLINPETLNILLEYRIATLIILASAMTLSAAKLIHHYYGSRPDSISTI